ncbi:MAG: hypothetical protein M3186_08750 [Actinomycetota bacterium]|nr:hypothetical protein [Actinomycetota bacterium]
MRTVEQLVDATRRHATRGAMAAALAAADRALGCTPRGKSGPDDLYERLYPTSPEPEPSDPLYDQLYPASPQTATPDKLYESVFGKEWEPVPK